MSAWTDRFVGDRMAVDREFTQRVAASEFSSQEWGTIMTAVEFQIENPETPSEAEVVADTSKVDQILPALEQMGDAMGMGGAGGGGGRGGGGAGSGRGGGSGAGGDGLFGSIKSSLGLGDGGDGTDQRAEAATALADEYAMQFQEHLEAQGKWEEACEVAAAIGDAPRGEHAEEAAEESAEEPTQESTEE